MCHHGLVLGRLSGGRLFYDCPNADYFLGLVMTAALMIVYERRMLALWQDRYGPNRVGWQGSLQLVADMLKIF